MDEFNNLEPRLQALEQMAQQLQLEKEEAAQEKQIQGLLDQYGMQFNNRRDVGMEILNQLNRQGVDVSAASSSAIQDIITDMQTQIAQLYDDFNQKRQEMDIIQSEAADLANKVNQIDQVVVDATSLDAASPTENEVPPVDAPVDAPVEGPVDTPVEGPAEAPVEGDVPPPVESTAEAPVESSAAIPENTTLSDVRVKNVETPTPMQQPQNYFIKRTNKVNVAPSPDILSDARVKDVKSSKPSFANHLISVARRSF